MCTNIRYYRAVDGPRVAAFLRAVHAGDGWADAPEDEAFEAFVTEHRDGGRDFLLCEDDHGALRGVLLSAKNTVTDRPLPLRTFRLVVSSGPWWTQVFDGLMSRLSRLDTSGRVIWRTTVAERWGDTVGALETHGFQRVQAVHLMRRAGVPPLPVVPPAGYILREPALPDEAVAIVAGYNRAYVDAFGFSPLGAAELLTLAEAPGGRLVVLNGPGGLVGAFHTLPFLDGIGLVQSVWVLPEAQGLGLGRLLTISALNALAQQGYAPVELAVDAANGRAVALYESLGFLLKGRDLTYERSCP